MVVSEHREEHLDLCAAYALGDLDPVERLRLEEHLSQGCATCEAALADFSDATVLLAASVPAAQPSAALRGKVLALVAAEPTEPTKATDGQRKIVELRPRRPTARGNWAWGAIAAALALTSVLLFRETSRLHDQLEASRRELAVVGRQLAEEERLNQVLSAPGARVAVLEITPAGEEALRARATYDPATRNAVVVLENFRAPAGHDYELWAIRGATPASLGVIHPDARGNAIIHLADVGDPSTLNAFAVSLEPAGGSPNPAAPSGPVVMLGKLGS